MWTVAAQVEASLLRFGWDVVKASPNEYWEVYGRIASAGGDDPLQIPQEAFILGRLGAGQPSEALCVSALPRMFAGRGSVASSSHRSAYFSLANNPYICEFVEGLGVDIDGYSCGTGHIIQRLERACGLPISPFPRPDIYLSPGELAWTAKIRTIFPRDRGVALLVAPKSGGAALWNSLVTVFARTYTVIQLIVSQRKNLEETIDLDGLQCEWTPDPVVAGVCSLENLSARQYLALFSVADAYLGPIGASLHAAAAFNVPSFVTCAASQLASPQLYPQDRRLVVGEAVAATEDLRAVAFP